MKFDAALKQSQAKARKSRKLRAKKAIKEQTGEISTEVDACQQDQGIPNGAQVMQQLNCIFNSPGATTDPWIQEKILQITRTVEEVQQYVKGNDNKNIDTPMAAATPLILGDKPGRPAPVGTYVFSTENNKIKLEKKIKKS